MKRLLRSLRHQQWDAMAPDQHAFNDAQAALELWLERTAQFFVQRLIADAEPRVWYTCDAEGSLWWHAHDPVTSRSLYDASEAEIRSWLEQRHQAALMH